MRKKIKESYFYRIFTSFFVICLVFALIMCGITSASFFRFYKSEIREQCIGTTEKFRAAMETAAEGYRKVLTELEDSEEVSFFFQNNENQNVNELMRELYMLKNSFIYKASISVVRLSDRKWVSTTEQVMEESHAEFSRWGVFRRANETDEVVSYAVARDALLNKESRFCMAKAVYGDKGILGYLLVEMPRSTIDAMMEEFSSQYNTSTVILNQSGSVIYSSQGTGKEGLGKRGFYSVEGGQGKSGITEEKFAFCRSEELGLVFLQELPSGTMSMIVETILKAMIPGVLVITLLALVLSRVLAKSISDPIREIIGTMAKIKKGDLSVRLNFERKDEIGQLGQAFDSMTERVGELMERIDEEKHSLWIAETRSLSLQMNPHFLYNTLDLIKWNAKLGKNREIVDITVLLGKVLRRIMNTRTDLVEVSYELEIVWAFVEIQKKHYGDRLNLTIQIPEEMLHCRIPKLVLQPIVENAIVHGFSDQEGECRIRITGRENQEKLEFLVEDNGCGLTSEELEHILEFRQEGSHHIGLNNVQRRARIFGDESCGLTVESRYGEGTRVRLVLKKMTEEGTNTDDESAVGGR